MRSSSMILRKCRIENPASSAAVGISKNIFVRAGLAVAVSVNISLSPSFRRVFLHLAYQCLSPLERRTPVQSPHTQRRTQDWPEGHAIFPTRQWGRCQETDEIGCIGVRQISLLFVAKRATNSPLQDQGLQ